MNSRNNHKKNNWQKPLYLLLLAIAGTGTAFCQQQTVVIKDAAGKPVQGASVMVRSTEKAVYSNAKGQFAFTPALGDTLVITARGYETQYLPAGETLSAVLLKAQQPGTEPLLLNFNNRIVPRYYTGEVVSISGAEMQRFNAPNATNSLAGRVPGVTTRLYSDEPGNDGSAFYIRGINTYNGDAPNVYVDNVPIGFNQLDQLEIDKVSVLKDAVSNGVLGLSGGGKSIFVTTRRGEAYKKEWGFFTSFGLQTPVWLPKFTGAKDYMVLYNEARANDGLGALFTPAQISAYDNGSNPVTNPDADWYGENLNQSAYVHKHNLTFSGGNNVMRYFILGGLMVQDGLYANTTQNFDKYGYNTGLRFNRYNLRSNFDFNITKSLSAWVDISGRIERRQSPNATANTIFSNMATYPSNYFPVKFSDGRIGGNAQYRSNPYALITRTGNGTLNDRTTFGTLGMTEKLDFLAKGLTASAAYTYYNLYSNYEGFFGGSPSYKVSSYVNGVEQVLGADAQPSYAGSNVGQTRIGSFWGKLGYDRAFGKNSIKAAVGYNQSRRTPYGDDFPYNVVNYFANTSLVFNKQFLLDASLSYSGNENFPKENQFHFYPAAGIGWVITENDAFRNNKLFNLLKVKASYGLLGNGDLGSGRSRYYFIDQYYSGTSFLTGQNPTSYGGYTEGPIANRNVAPEKIAMISAGIEAAMCRNNLGFAVSVFKEKRSDILTTPQNITGILGQNLRPVNVGIMENKGVDGYVWAKKQMGAVGFNLGANFTLQKNKIIEQAEIARPYPYQYRTGLPAGTVFGLKAIGFFKDAADVAASPKQYFGYYQAGDVKYADINNDGVVDNNDVTSIAKSAQPTTSYGFHAGISWRGFEATAWFQGAAGYSTDMRTLATYGFAYGGKPTTNFLTDRWTPQNPNATFPRLGFNNGANNMQASDFWIKDTRYLRFKNLELAYQQYLDKSKLGVRHLRFFVSMLNPYTWSNVQMEGFDPEYTPSGISAYPRMRSTVFGIQATF